MTNTPKLQMPRKFSPEPIAIVGLGAVMPDANSVEEFWQNVMTGKDSIHEVPKDRWDPQLYYHPDRSIPDKTYSKIGAFVKNFKINPIEFRIPPNVLEQIDLVQQWALASAKEALEDANYGDEDFPRERCAVIVGNSLGGEKSFEVSQRVYFPALVRSLKETKKFQNFSKSEQDELIQDLENRYKAKIPEINEDSMPGELPNIVAGRIAAVFNLRGKNMISDAACASSLAAIDIAYKGLQTQEFDAAVVGGSDRSMDPPTYVKFSKIGALSPDGSRPFDKDANGFVMGEGAGMMVLKRLSDAIKADNKIYALITGVGSSSDGKGKGITAPNPIGQELSIRRAYETAGISPGEIQLIECHGTSTTVGDVVEIDTLENVYREANVDPNSVRIGSIKSQIGHLKSASGAAGLLKTALAIRNKVYPPSINFDNPNPAIDWNTSPFVVNTHPQKWKVENNNPRRAAVSSFGFGGTNFHVILEEYDPSKDYQKSEETYETIPKTRERGLTWKQYLERNRVLLPEPILLSANSADDLVEKVSQFPNNTPSTMIDKDEFGATPLDLLHGLKFDNNDNYRVGFALGNLEDTFDALDLVKGAIKDPKKQKFARAKGIFISESLPQGKLGFVFPGQGSQYVGMMFDLARKYNIVQQTVDEADKILSGFIEKPLSEYIWAKGEYKDQLEDQLRQTEITQPAVLTADIALYRLLKEFGVFPDIVAGHSLGEYAALVVSGVISFDDALKAVAIRGKNMAEVNADDKGTMASISGTLEEIKSVLETIDGYVIAANKNSTSSTVISGSTIGVKKAMDAFKERGMTAIELFVSAAFHTKIVEPASGPLSEFLDKITFNKPKIPITSNVTGSLFPDDPEGIRELMKKQVGSPVEWIQQIRTMHNQGATRFFEVGPKRALSTFINDILGESKAISLACNHPKKGGIRTFNEALAALFALGYDLAIPQSNSNKFHPQFRWPQYKLEKISSQPKSLTQRDLVEISGEDRKIDALIDKTVQYLQSDSGKVRKLGLNLDRIVVTGVGMGLPGQHKEVFSEDNIERILKGENLIDKLPKYKLDAQLNKNIKRLIKKSSGEAEFHSPKSYEEVIRLAGQQGKFDLVEEYGVDDGIAGTFDIATQLAVASGLEALKDAGIPLVRDYRKTKTGSYLPKGWVLPPELQEDTGVVFASAFPGYDNFAREITDFNEHKYKKRSRERLTELYGEISRRVSGQAKDYLLEKIDRELVELDKTIGEYTFNRKLLLNVLSMGHSQFAQLIKAKGPNTQINAACASTTQALGVASDWIRSGRCKRVIIISADNVTTDNLFEWLGSGFLASGAASIKEKVEEAALPFDRRRGGMIIGMGAAGLLVESEEEAQRRGVIPIVEILGTHYSNSAYHGTRLDVNHVSSELQTFMDRIELAHGISPKEVGQSLMFMSHETYTPRRGGSAAAEIQSLKDTFGDKASEIHIANTKGFTGHAMGAGIEDAVAIKSIERGQIPPIANFKQPDPDLGNLKLSSGEKARVDFALRLAAGFGSQIAFVLYKRRSHGDRFGLDYEDWLRTIGGSKNDLYQEGKNLRLRDNGVSGQKDTTKTTSLEHSAPLQPTSSEVAKPAQPIATSPKRNKREVNITERSTSVEREEVMDKILDVMTDITGYDKKLLDPNLDIEGDLGVDTIKIAEGIGQMNKAFGLQRKEGMNLADYPTLNHVADYYVERLETEEPSAEVIEGEGKKVDDIFDRIKAIVSEATGYPESMVAEDTLNLREDLGVNDETKLEIDKNIGDVFEINPKVLDNIHVMRDIVETIKAVESDKVDTVEPIEREQTADVPEETGGIDEVESMILGIISEISGYPEIMLDESIHLQNDLGIDKNTTQQIQEKIASELNQKVTNFEGCETIADFLDVTSDSSEITADEMSKIVSKSDAIAEMEIPEDFEREDVLDEIVEIIVDKTGYPKDLIDPKADLEAELGIDTVKQVDILASVREKFSIPPIDGLLVAEYNTVNKITDLIAEKIGEGFIEPTESQEVQREDKKDVGTHRYVIRYKKDNEEGKYSGKGLIIAKKTDEHVQIVKELGFKRKASIRTEPGVKKGETLILLNPFEYEIVSIYEFFRYIKSQIDNLRKLVLAVNSQKQGNPSIHGMTPLQGAIGGMFKALAREFPNIECKIIIYETVEQIRNELGLEETEVVYQENERYVVSLMEENLLDIDWKLPDNKVILATGGAQGITFEILKNVLQKGCVAILLGRTKMRDDAAEIASLTEKELEQRKWQLMSDLKDRIDKVTPVVLEKEWSKVVKSANVHSAISELNEMGVDVIYKSVDVTDPKLVAERISEIKDELSNNLITHFIHGAGLEISRATKSKKVDEFQTVYDVKVRGFENIITNLDMEHLERIVTFSSIAGRFGNATQVDYSAANEYLAKRCAELSKEKCHVTIFDWSAWAEVGMATRGSTMQVLETQGITAIPLEEGISRFKQEMAQGTETEVVISGELGQLTSKISWFEPDYYRGIMMDDFSGSTLESMRVLSLTRDRYLDDHRINGIAVLPGVMGLETMAEVARTIKDASVMAFFNVSFTSPVKLSKDKDLEIVTQGKRIGGVLDLDLKSKFIGPDGKQLGDLRQHFNASVVTGEKIPSYPVLNKNSIRDIENAVVMNLEDIYGVFFHGSSYQVLNSLNYISNNSAVATFHRPGKTMFEEKVELEIDPLMIEGAFQAAGLHLLCSQNTMGLPASIEALYIFEALAEAHFIRVIYNNSTDTHSSYNVEVVDKHGKCIVLLYNYQMVHTGTVDSLGIQMKEDKSIDIVKSITGEISEDLVCVEVDCLEEVEDSFIQRILYPAELSRYSGLEIKKKRLEWLAGRIAAKIAVSKHLLVSLDEIEIQKDENRSPFSVINGNKHHLSISHSHGIALAIAGDQTVDIEKIEERGSSFIEESFSKSEIDKYGLMEASPSKIIRFWTIKEAHLKRMRIGLKTDLHGVEVVSNGRDQSEVESSQGKSIVKSISKNDWVVSIASPVS